MVKTLTALKLLDVVTIKEDLLEHGLLAGQVGTIVEVLAPEVYEVDFSDDDGQTYAMLPLHSSQLLQLKYSYTPKNPPMSNTIHQYGQGDNVAGDKVGGDKVGGDKIINNANTAELLQLISSMRETAAQFPEDIRDGIILDIEAVEAEVNKPEKEWNKGSLKKSLTALVALAGILGTGVGGAIDIANNAIDLGEKVGIELKLPSGR